MPTLQNHSPSGLTTTSGAALEQQQRRRMMIALLVLLVALVLVLIKDRQILFPQPSAESEGEPAAGQSASRVVAQEPAAPPSSEKSLPGRQEVRASREPITATVVPGASESTPPVVAATTRAVLPPLEVEVIAGNQRHPVDSSTSSVNVRMQDGLSPAPVAGQTQAGQTAGGGAERVQLSPGASQVVDRPVEPSYPLLAKQMKVQGAVVLEALISKAGTIQDIQVLSGPAILSAAAREAVRQWRFKPYLQAGKPVDSQARVTVNFTISTY